MVQRIAAGCAVAHVAAETGISRTTAWRWLRRYRDQGRAGLIDRSSHPRSCPHSTSACVEVRIRIWRQLARRGAVDLARRVGVPASTVGRALARHDNPVLRECNPITGTAIRAPRRSATGTSTPTRARWCTSMSRSSAASRTAVGGRSTGAPLASPTGTSAHRSGSTSCAPRPPGLR